MVALRRASVRTCFVDYMRHTLMCSAIWSSTGDGQLGYVIVAWIFQGESGEVIGAITHQASVFEHNDKSRGMQ